MRRALKVRFSFQAKVLLTVISIMVLLIAASMWIVNRRITAQLQADVQQQLITADAIFKNSQKIRTKELLRRYGNVINEPRFKAISRLEDAQTYRFYLSELIQEGAAEVGLLTTATGQPPVSASRDPQFNLPEFASRSSVSVKRALEGQQNVDTVRVGERLYYVVSIPVRIGDEIVSTLTFGVESGESTVEEFKELTHSELIFFANDHIAASTLLKSGLIEQLSRRFDGLGAAGLTGNSRPHASPLHEITLDGEHFLGLTGQFASLSGDEKLGYLLLSSSESQLNVLRATQRALGAISIGGLVLGIAIVWALIRKITQPLRQLRNSVEAVGRGDFSARAEVTSQDECGELALAFNQMTENLNGSRAELEKTVETLRTTQAQLVQSEKLSAIGEFVAGVTHELNNPLTSVIGFAELLQQSNVNERHRKYLDLIVNSAQRCHKIVQSLLSFARQHKPERKLLQVHELVEAAVGILQYQMRTSNIQVVTSFDPCLPAVMADAHQLQQVFLNIINNARQAIEGHRPKGLIRISTSANEGRVQILFEDDGPGIPEESLGKIFNPFFTTKEVGKGTGLGLSLSYGIIQEHAGAIRVHSIMGQGAAFVIELPAAQPSNETTETALPQSSPVPVFDGRGKRVLVVDDEDSILSLIHDALAAQGFQLDVARNGETALLNLQQTRYDLTICDWKMPGLNGQQVYERLRASDPRAAERFIFITGDVVNEKTRQFIQEQGSLCISKPFSLDEFRAAVGKTLRVA